MGDKLHFLLIGFVIWIGVSLASWLVASVLGALVLSLAMLAGGLAPVVILVTASDARRGAMAWREARAPQKQLEKNS